jgi:hypothetical protein
VQRGELRHQFIGILKEETMFKYLKDHFVKTMKSERGWLTAALAAIPGIASIMGGLFGKKETPGQTVNIEDMTPDWQKQMRTQMADWVQKYLKDYAPGEAYGGKMTAGMSTEESGGLSILDKFLSGSSIGDLFKAGKGQIMDTLSGKYADPNTSPFIKSMRDVSNQDLTDAINASRRGTASRNKFFSTAALGEEKDLTNRNLQNLNSIIGSFMQNERQNMLGAVPVANAMDQYENVTAPMTQVQASQTYGSLSRILEQADLEAQYNDYSRQRSELGQLPQTGLSLSGMSSQLGIPSWQMPSTTGTNSLGNIMNLLSGLNFSSLGGKGDIWSKLAGLFTKKQ